ncbi:MAG: tricorn protease [Glaciecola sp.]|jgi:tricorn protease
MKQIHLHSLPKLALLSIVFSVLSTQALASIDISKVGYFRTPSIHDNTIVFAAEGDLWRVEHQSGLLNNEAVRLTTHSSEEMTPFISPNGEQIAFSANYEGTTEVYLTSVKGGAPQRITFENSRAMVKGWTQKGDILYATSTTITGPANSWVLKTVDPRTLVVTNIEVSDAVEGVIDDKSNTIYFVQHGLQISNDNANQYKGGATGELWRFNMDNKDEAIKLTEAHSGSVKNPMLFNQQLYFISNQSGIDNIWRMSLNGKNAEPVTTYTDWGVRSASMHNGKIAYQLGADIMIFNVLQNRSEKASIALTSDFPHLRERWIEKPLIHLTQVSLAPNGNKVVLTARGRIAVAGTDTKRLVEINTMPTSRSRKATLNIDNKSVFVFNDDSGESEIWQFWLDGQTEPKQLTNDGKTSRLNMWLSPDGSKLAHDTKHGELFILDIESGESSLLFKDISAGVNSFKWFKDNDTIALAYTKRGNERVSVLLHSLSLKKSETLSTQKYASYSPTFSADGKWLYFLSDRNFNANPNSPWGDRNMGAAFDRTTEIYAIALNTDSKFAFAEPQENVELSSETDDEKMKDDASASNDDASDKTQDEESTNKSSDDDEKVSIEIIWQGIQQRLWKVPVKAGNYSQLAANDSFLYVVDKANEPNSRAALKSISIEHEPTLRTFATAISSYQLSDNGKSILVHKGRRAATSMYVVTAGSVFPSDARDNMVQTQGWKMRIEPQNEWRQIFKDAWLMHRDSLFDADMRGVDWLATKAKYEPLLTRLTDRRELNDIFKQMMGELNTLHSQVRGGDISDNDKTASSSSLGAAFMDSADGVVVSHIYLHDDELPGEASPLARPNVNAMNGDIIKAINNNVISTVADLVKQLKFQSGKQVLLTLERNGEKINTVVKPESSRNEGRYRYRNWVYTNAHKVSEQDNEIGYLHLYAMTGNDLSSFAKEFYAQYKKQGLIIDVRRNRGGNIDSIIIEKLLRRTWSFWQGANGERSTNMQQTFQGHLVVLADEFTYSDGETFTAGIKALDLGTVIGKQTAGAGVWLSGGNSVVDAGVARVAEFPVFDMNGHWITEGRGISPDIEVNNMPHATYKGNDAQLTKAIAYLQKKIKKQPIPKYKTKPFPAVEVSAEDIK